MATDPFVDLSDVEATGAPAGNAGSTGSGDVAEPVAASDADERLPSVKSAPVGAPARPVGDEIDLTGALGTLDATPATDPPRATLDQVFEKIREDAGERPDYSQQHMTLARTYLEMGQVDDAIGALKIASKSVIHRFESTSLLGRLYRDRGQLADSIEWLERAAEASAPDAEAARALLYDLGCGLDEAGEVARALAVFLELQSEAGDYRDVPSRIDRLARVQAGG
jgi:tetratricopeptide (TPR) repeat protein